MAGPMPSPYIHCGARFDARGGAYVGDECKLFRVPGIILGGGTAIVSVSPVECGNLIECIHGLLLAIIKLNPDR